MVLLVERRYIQNKEWKIFYHLWFIYTEFMFHASCVQDLTDGIPVQGLGFSILLPDFLYYLHGVESGINMVNSNPC